MPGLRPWRPAIPTAGSKSDYYTTARATVAPQLGGACMEELEERILG